MEVFRVEKNGSGPYDSWGTDVNMHLRTHHWHKEQGAPGPNEDGIEDMSEICIPRYGFESFSHLQRWFHRPDTRILLNKDGFHLSVYQVDDDKVLKGNRQVVFDLNSAVVVRKLPIPL